MSALHQIWRLCVRCMLAILLTTFFVNTVSAGMIRALRVGQSVGSARLVFDADAEFDYNVFLLTAPKRLVIDVKHSKVNSKLEQDVKKNTLLSNLRVGATPNGDTRIAFDLKQPAIVKKAFMLPPQSNFGWRFVVDLEVATEKEFASHVGNQHAFISHNMNKSSKPQQNKFISKNNAKKIIVLDPGHGGQDPGAIGCSGVYEKNITLAMAKELKQILDKNGQYKVYLTRNRDVFIPLRERVRIARRYKADLFLSIHADSARNKNAKGLSVYTLSETASDKEAAALAERENKADVIAGMDFAEHSKEVSDVLINLAQRETMNRSSEFANFMVQEMRKSVKLLDNTHRFAGFAVLKAPDVPAILLEMGYLSNRHEEKLLRQSSYRKKLAKSASVAIDRYFDNMQHASLF